MKELQFNLDSNLIPIRLDTIPISSIPPVLDTKGRACKYELVLKFSHPDADQSQTNESMQSGLDSEGEVGFRTGRTGRVIKEFILEGGLFNAIYKGYPFGGKPEQGYKLGSKFLEERMKTGCSIEPCFEEKRIQAFIYSYFVWRLTRTLIEKVKIKIIPNWSTKIYERELDFNMSYFREIQNWLDKTILFYSGQTLVKHRLVDTMGSICDNCGNIRDICKEETIKRCKSRV